MSLALAVIGLVALRYHSQMKLVSDSRDFYVFTGIFGLCEIRKLWSHLIVII